MAEQYNFDYNQILVNLQGIVANYIDIWTYKQASEQSKEEAKRLLYEYLYLLADFPDVSMIDLQEQINCALAEAGLPGLFWQWNPHS